MGQKVLSPIDKVPVIFEQFHLNTSDNHCSTGD
jgi:hypothetical protein